MLTGTRPLGGTAAGVVRRPWLPPAGRLAAAAVLLAVGAFVAQSYLYAHFTPIGQAPDENAHLAYVRLIALHLRLPVNVREDQQPPLYYAAAALLYRLTGTPVAAQWLSIALGALTLAVVWATARTLYPGRPWRQALPVIVAASVPQLQFISGAITDDGLSFLSGAVLIWLTILVLRRPPSTGLCAAIGAAVAAALLAKETDYVLAALLLATAAVAWWRRGWRHQYLLIAVLPLLGAGWWFARNLAVFHHLLPGLAPMRATPLHLRHLAQLHAWYDTAVRSSVAYFGNMTTSVKVAGSPDMLYRGVEAGLGLLAIVGCAAVARRWPAWAALTRASAAVVALAIGLAGLQMLINSVVIDYQAQGRYLFVALSAGSLAVSFSLATLLDRLRPAWSATAAGLLVAALAAIDVLGVLTVRSGLIT